MNFNLENFGLKKYYLYEIIACTYSETEKGKELKPNTSCIGIKIDEDNLIEIDLYPNTTTYKNLNANGLITINFVDNIYLYALAALKKPDFSKELQKFPTKHYKFKKLETRAIPMPYINEAWGVLICEVVRQLQKIKKNGLGEVSTSVFKLKVIFCEKLKESFKLFNRAENLALEIIILATRLKVAKEMKNRSSFDNIREKIIDHMETVKIFGKNENTLKTIEIVNDYIKYLTN